MDQLIRDQVNLSKCAWDDDKHTHTPSPPLQILFSGVSAIRVSEFKCKEFLVYRHYEAFVKKVEVTSVWCCLSSIHGEG